MFCMQTMFMKIRNGGKPRGGNSSACCHGEVLNKPKGGYSKGTPSFKLLSFP